jgi:hypothetical protein
VIGWLAGAAASVVLLAGPAMAADLPEPETTIEGGRVVLVLDDTETSSHYIPKGGEPTEEFPDEQPAVGDAFSFTDDLRQDGDLVGTSEGTCTVLPENAISCAATFTFAGGTVRASGPVDEGEDETAPSTIAITGGTGDYAGISGTLTILDKSDEADPSDTLSTLTLRYSLPDSLPDSLPAETTQVAAVPAGGAETGGGAAGSTDRALFLGVGIAALAGAAGLFGAAQHAARRS